jgi:hypothetical protein
MSRGGKREKLKDKDETIERQEQVIDTLRKNLRK